MSTPRHQPTLLGELDTETFLERYWQREPLLVRGACGGLESALGPDELAGLAIEPEAIARLVFGAAADGSRELRHGPFEAAELTSLPERDWTLLVQEVDRHVAPVAAVLDRVRFLPNWRIDDVMVSFAPTGGGVGAHIDRYDVFLIQTSGRRRWSIEQRPRPMPSGPTARALTERSAVMHPLDGFEPTLDWELDPGDVLYLPPGFAHDGVALEPCMTWSIGFRAPTAAELCASLLETAGEALRARRYSDPPFAPRDDDPGRLIPSELGRARELLLEAVHDDELWLRAMGRASTLPVRRMVGGLDDDDDDDDGWTGEALRAALAEGAQLDRHALGELAWAPAADGRVLLFASGDVTVMPPDAIGLAQLITGTRPLDAAALGPLLHDGPAVGVLTDLLARGTLTVID